MTRNMHAKGKENTSKELWLAGSLDRMIGPEVIVVGSNVTFSIASPLGMVALRRRRMARRRAFSVMY